MAGESKDDESQNYDVKACAPSDLSSAEFAACVAVIKEGDAVDPDSAEAELPHAKVLAVARKRDDIVGVGAIKRPRPQYAARIAARSGYSFDPNTPELGYVAVDPKHKKHGLSHRIVAELLSKHEGPLFATTHHPRMKKTLEKPGFVQKGGEWKGRRGQLSLWTRD